MSLDLLRHEIKYSLSHLRRSPTFSLIAILTLTLGIGANAAVFALLNTVVLRDLPVKNPGRLVTAYRITRNDSWAGITVGQIEAIRARQQVFDGMFGRSYPNPAAVQIGDQSWPINLGYVTGEYYSVLGVRPYRGRLLNVDDVGLPDGTGSAVATVSYDFWEQHLGAVPDVLGKRVLIGGSPFTIIGITPKGFFGEQVGFSLDFTVPITERLDRRAASANSDLFCQYLVARLRDGVSTNQARAQLEAMWPDIRVQTLASNLSPAARELALTQRLRVSPYPTNGFSFLRDQFSKPLVVLVVISSLVLLLCCLTLATLQLARASVRRRELGTRLALGASSVQLMRQLFIESSMLGVAGASGGLAFAYWASNRLVGFWGTQIATTLDLRPDRGVLAYTAASAIVTAVIFGIGPAWHACHQPLSEAIREGSAGSGMLVRRYGKVLIVLQVGLSVMTVTAGGLLARSFLRLRSIEQGFVAQHVVALELQPTLEGRARKVDVEYCRGLINGLAEIPGVESVALSHLLPGSGIDASEKISARDVQAGAQLKADFQQVSPEFFTTMHIPLLRGRAFRWQDDDRAPRVAIASVTLARDLFPTGDAVGRRISVGTSPDRADVEIVGIVADARLRDIRQLSPYIVYVPYVQEPVYISFWTDVEMRLNGVAPDLVPLARGRVSALGREYLRRSMPITDVIESTIANEHALAVVSGYFTLLSLLLSGIGLYGLLAYSVSVRKRELAIRVALGCRRGGVVWLVLREALLLTFLGLVLGMLGVLAATRPIAHFLVNLSPHDPVTMVLVVVELLTVCCLTGVPAALYAARTDPADYLRYQ
jgi:predicted permease